MTFVHKIQKLISNLCFLFEVNSAYNKNRMKLINTKDYEITLMKKKDLNYSLFCCFTPVFIHTIFEKYNSKKSDIHINRLVIDNIL